MQDIIWRRRLIEADETVLNVPYNRWCHLAARKLAQISPCIRDLKGTPLRQAAASLANIRQGSECHAMANEPAY